VSVFSPTTGRILEVNDAWLARYGYSRDEAHTMTVKDVSAEPSATMSAIGAAATTGGAVINLRWHRTRDGHVFPVELTSGMIVVDGETLMYAVMHDITERRRAEEAVMRSEARFRALVEALPDAVVVHRGGRVIYGNPAFRALHGFAPDDELRGLTVDDLVAPSDRADSQDRIDEVLADGAPVRLRDSLLLRRDGTVVPAEITAIRIDLDGEPALLAIARDLRPQKAMEARLVLADRLASLGRLAASVGHEINNPIGYVMAMLEVLRRDVQQLDVLPEPSRLRLLGRLDVVEEGAARVRDIVRDLKVISTSEPRVIGPIEIHRVLDVCANMAEHEVKQRARLVRAFGESLFVDASEARLGQVFLNLLLNACQAIEPGRPDENEIRICTGRNERGDVFVEIRDTGHGVPDSLRERVFEPFFTTRDGAGTGLGLSISHSIVSEYKGTIRMESNDGPGSCFRVTLPTARMHAVAEHAAG
jgi:PAS domain S-box-containing protein